MRNQERHLILILVGESIDEDHTHSESIENYAVVL